MCGRYYVDDETTKEIEKIVREVSTRMEQKKDVCPSNSAMVLHKGVSSMKVADMSWGFPGHGDHNLIINARIESAMQKPTFKNSIVSRRCIIPAKGFYEWDKSKNKIQFERMDQKVLYMAGIWKPGIDSNCFVILTTAANTSVISVHNRMPLILEQNELENWIFDHEFIEYAVHKVPTVLNKITPDIPKGSEYKQMSLFEEK